MNEEQIQRENALIFGRTGGKMFNIIEKIISNNPHFFDNSNAALNQSRDMNGASDAGRATYNGQLVNFEKKWVDLEVALARDGGLLDTFTNGLKYSSEMMEKMTKLSHEYPQVTKFVGEAALAVTGLAALSGGVWVFKHAASALIDPVKFLAGGAGFPLLKTAISAVMGESALPLMAARLALLPATLTGIGLAAWGIYEGYEWYKKNGVYDANSKASTSEATKGSSGFNVTNPDAAAEYRHLIDPTHYPDPHQKPKAMMPPVPVKSSATDSRPVNLMMTSEGRKVIVATVIDGMGKVAGKPPAGPSAFDSSMLLTYPGQVSGLSTK